MRLIAKTVSSLIAAPLIAMAMPALANDAAEAPGAVPMASVAVSSAIPAPAQTPLVDPRAAAQLNRSLEADNVPLPPGGVEEACRGFPTLFRCLSALHLAKNVRVVGGFDPVREMLLYDNEASVADAARAFAPEVDPVAAEKAAQGQAMGDLRKAGVVR